MPPVGVTVALNGHDLTTGDLTVESGSSLTIANSHTPDDLPSVVLNVQGAATVGVPTTDSPHDTGSVTVGSGTTLNFNGSVNWHNSEDVVNLTVLDGGTVNVNNGSANSLNGITVQEGGSLSFAVDTATDVFGPVSLAEQVVNDGTLDFGGRAIAIALPAEHHGLAGERPGRAAQYNPALGKLEVQLQQHAPAGFHGHGYQGGGH